MLLEDLEFGGTQRQALELARRLNPERFQVELWMMRSGNDFNLSTTGRRIPLRWLSRSTVVGPASLARLAMLLRSQPVDLLLLLTAIPNIWGRLLGRAAGIPRIVATCRGEGGPLRQHERLLWRLADHHLCNSRALKERLTGRYGVPEAMVSVILNGIDTEHFTPVDRGPDREGCEVLCVARLVSDKDHRTLIEAFERLLLRIPDARLQLVGEGPLRRNLLETARDRLPAQSFQWQPGSRELRPLYRRASLFALSSIQEGLPNVVLEAMACGLPVVATNVGGLGELVADGMTGSLVPPKDPAALADAMVELLLEPEKASVFGRAGRKRVVEQFSVGSAVRAHEDLFRRLLGEAH
jgi:glycosyltransferase involved in cell wall biosynthesis